MAESNGKQGWTVTVLAIIAAVVISMAAALGTHIDNEMSQIIQNQNEILRSITILSLRCGVKPEDLK